MNIAQVPPLSGTNVTWISFAMQLMFLLETLPCSKQLSFQVIPQLSGWVWVLKAEVPGVQPKQIPSWHVWGRGGRGRREGEGEGEGGGGGEGERESKGKEWKKQSEVIQLHKPKIKLKYPEAIWICLLSFCGRQIEKTVLQIWHRLGGGWTARNFHTLVTKSCKNVIKVN